MAGNGERFRIPDGEQPRIGIAAKLSAEEAIDTARGLAAWLTGLGAEVTVEERLAGLMECKRSAATREELGERRHLVVVLGGDGTLLSVARAMGTRQVPIFGVNLGSLGFLTKASLDQLYKGLVKILAGESFLDTRSTLAVVVRRGNTVLREEFAINDVVVTGGAVARVMQVRVATARGFVATILGDGVIIASPTGSTAYSLGAGGPVVHPAVEAIVLAPIVPLTLTQRPMVFPDNEELTLTLRGRRQPVHVTFDGQASQPLHPGDSITVGRSPVRMQLLSPPGINYFRVLRKKLLWSALPPKRGRTTPPIPPEPDLQTGQGKLPGRILPGHPGDPCQPERS